MLERVNTTRMRDGIIHVHDVLYLFSPVADAQFAFLELLGHLLLLVRILRGDILHVFDEALNISET